MAGPLVAVGSVTATAPHFLLRSVFGLRRKQGVPKGPGQPSRRRRASSLHLRQANDRKTFFRCLCHGFGCPGRKRGARGRWGMKERVRKQTSKKEEPPERVGRPQPVNRASGLLFGHQQVFEHPHEAAPFFYQSPEAFIVPGGFP